MRTVSDTSPISNLAIIGQLGLLREQFGEVSIPTAVFAESVRLSHPAARQSIVQAIETGWLVVHPVSDTHAVHLLLSDLDQGEAEAIILGQEMDADLLLMDERDGRRVARERGFAVTGVLGVLLRAKKSGGLAAIRPHLEMLKADARFFIAPELERFILTQAGE